MSERIQYTDGEGISFINAAQEPTLHNMSPGEFIKWLKKINAKHQARPPQERRGDNLKKAA